MLATPEQEQADFYFQKSTFPCFVREKVFSFQEDEVNIDRREFAGKIGMAVAAIATASCGSMPSSPTQPSIQTPSTPAIPTPQPSNPASQYGTWYRGGTVGISGGTLEQALRAAQLNPETNNQGLLVRLDGRAAPLVGTAISNPNSGAYFVYINGQHQGTEVRNLSVNRGDRWDLFDWNGRHPSAQLATLGLDTLIAVMFFCSQHVPEEA